MFGLTESEWMGAMTFLVLVLTLYVATSDSEIQPAKRVSFTIIGSSTAIAMAVLAAARHLGEVLSK